MLGADRDDALLTLQDALDHVAHGVPALMQCLFDGAVQPHNRVINLRNMDDAGGTILGYFSPNGSLSSLDLMLQASNGVPHDLWSKLRHLVYDVEEGNAPWVPIARVWEDLARVAGLGFTKVIYTNYDTWTRIYGNPAFPPDVSLLNADWDGKLAPLLPLPFGGLSEGDPRILGKQYLNGVDEDLLVLNLDPPAPPPAPAPYFVRFESQVFLSDKTTWNLTGTYDPPTTSKEILDSIRTAAQGMKP